MWLLHLALEFRIFPPTSDYLRASVSWALEIRAEAAEAVCDSVSSVYVWKKGYDVRQLSERRKEKACVVIGVCVAVCSVCSGKSLELVSQSGQHTTHTTLTTYTRQQQEEKRTVAAVCVQVLLTISCRRTFPSNSILLCCNYLSESEIEKDVVAKVSFFSLNFHSLRRDVRQQVRVDR